MIPADPYATPPRWHTEEDNLPWPEGAPAPGDAHNHATILAQARGALTRRRAAYPAMIEQDRIDPDFAARDIAAWQVIVGEWTWIAEGPGAPGAALPSRVSIAERIGAADLGIIRVLRELDRGRSDPELFRQYEALLGLRWQLGQQRAPGVPRVHDIAALNHALHASLRAERNPELREAA